MISIKSIRLTLLFWAILFSFFYGLAQDTLPPPPTHILLFNRHPNPEEEDYKQDLIKSFKLGLRNRIKPTEEGLLLSVISDNLSESADSLTFPYHPRVVLKFGQQPIYTLGTTIEAISSVNSKLSLIKDKLFYDDTEASNTQVFIYSTSGQKIIGGVFNKDGFFPLSTLPDGIYIAVTSNGVASESLSFYLRK